MSRRNLAWLLGVPAVVVVGLTLVFAAPRPQKNRDEELDNVKLLVDILSEVDQKYVRELTPDQRKKLVEDMINGGLERLDPYSGYFNADEYRLFTRQTEGAFGGVGIQIDPDHTTGFMKVTSPMVGTPAYEAGVLAGDFILKVDGKSTESLRTGEIIKLVQGEPGTDITLTLLHEGAKEPVDLTMTRAKIEFPSVMGDRRKPNDPAEWDFIVDKANKIGYVRLIAFNEHSAGDLSKAVEKMEAEGVRGLVLDLRDNPGGLLTQAVAVSNLFIKSGAIVSIRDRRGVGKTYEAKATKTHLEPAAAHPLVVLVNRNSASASEIVAAALQDHKRAAVVGERSYGKGSVQNVIELPDREPKVALKLTTASYWRPSGANIHRALDAKETDEWGVKPDANLEVKLKPEERAKYLIQRRKRDVVQGKPGAGPAKSAQDDLPLDDKVLDKALEYLRGELTKG
ncbi:MAG: S41 family peptidase [Gemmataceae bacterium]